MATRPLSEVAKTIRSKNAGVDRITFDVIFADRADYQRVRQSGVLSRMAVCRIFNIADSRITDYVEFDPALAIKFTIARSITSGSPGDADIFGSQQYGPLLGVAVPAE
jgi:limonene-1,2-epoxide hydrolase